MWQVNGSSKMMKLSLISTKLDLIHALILPLIMKLEAVRQTALVKVQQWTGLNTHTLHETLHFIPSKGWVFPVLNGLTSPLGSAVSSTC